MMLNFNNSNIFNAKRNKGYSYTKYKLKYDNNIIKRKMNEIKNKSGPYNIKILRPKNDIIIKRSDYFNIKKIEDKIKNENDKKLKRRIKRVKSSYDNKILKKRNEELNSYRNFYLGILRKNRENPFVYSEMENILNS